MSDSIPPIVEAVLQYASRRGWAVLPMREKKFYTRYGVRIATRDPNIIKQWGWAESFGMACGEPSRTDVFDIDDAEAFAAAGFFNAGRNNAIRRAALVLRVCRTSQPGLSLGRMAVDRPCGCAATGARAKVAQRSDSAASAARTD